MRHTFPGVVSARFIPSNVLRLKRSITAIYRGTVNDPTPFPPPSKSHGSYHWAFERILSAGLVPLTVASFVTSGTNYPIIDGLLGVSLVMHSHIGVRIFASFVLHSLVLLSCSLVACMSDVSRA